MTSSGLTLNFVDGFLVRAKNQRMGTDPGTQMGGTGQGEVKRPPNHNELTAVQHPNSKIRLVGSKSYAAKLLSGFRASDIAILTFDATNQIRLQSFYAV
jgi:hypothetical protein